MKVPLSWLKEYVDVPLSLESLAERLTLAGLEVARVEYLGLPGADLVWDRERVLVGEIVEIRPHPNADRLVLAVVNYGSDQHETVVTGAPNLFPYRGQSDLHLKVAFAMEGARLYDGYAEEPRIKKLKKTKIRGVSSRAMVCSEKELGLGDDHTGILLLPDDAPVGKPLADYLGDAVLDLDLTPNLARCFSIIGVAREVAALTGQRVRYPSLEVLTEGLPAAEQVRIEIEDPTLCPRYIGMVIRDVTIRPSPFWVQHRLRLAGMRPINNVVDVTNYVMLEWGQPLHAFDYDRLAERAGGEVPTILVRPARPGEWITTLDGVERELTPDDLLITDTAGPIAIAGVMGGAETEVTETTRHILLESANFHFISIRRTSKRLRLPSESSARFGRGVHPAMAERGVRRAAELMRRWGDGRVAPGMVDAYPAPLAPVVVDFPLGEVRRILGMEIAPSEVRRILEGLEFQVVPAGEDRWQVTVPDHRLDITGPADLLEEIARVYGYDRIPTTLMADELPPQFLNRPLVLEEQVRDLLAGLGLQEVITYRLTAPEQERKLYPPGLPSDDRPYVTLANPISQERRVMRHSLLASLLEVVAHNVHVRERVALFEVGPIFLPAEEGALPEEPLRLGIVLTGPREVPFWVPAEREPMDFYDLKGIVEALLEGLHVEGVRYEPAPPAQERPEAAPFHPGRVAEVWIGEEPVGLLGELHPLVREAFDLPAQPVLAADLALDRLLALVPPAHRVQDVPRYPAIQQDIAVIVDEAVPAARVQALIEAAGGKLLRRARLFDVYRGEPVPPGKKSLAYALTIQADDRTLTDREADKVRRRIVRRLETELDAVLRGQE